MTRSRRRRSRRRYPLRLLTTLAIASLALVALAFWYTYDSLATPDLIPRVLFAETAGCSQHERLLVAGVMHNRIRNPAFGNLPTLLAVVAQPGAFSCINDPANSLWQKSRHPDRLTAAQRTIWQDCLAIAQNPIPPALGPSGRPLVYYHDKSITKPRSWDNTRYHALRELETPHFIFYSILPTNPTRRWFP